MLDVFGGDLTHMISVHGYWVVLVFVGLESTGLPLPGETVLVTAAIYAGTTGQLDISCVISAAAGGAILGDTLGFWMGRSLGYRLVLRYGRLVGLSEGRIKLGQYLFLRHGGKVVFFGRFVAVLRIFAAPIAGASRMPWLRFLAANAAGGILWAATFGLGAYTLGGRINQIAGPVGFATIILAMIGVVAALILIRRNEERMQVVADRALPGPLQ